MRPILTCLLTAMFLWPGSAQAQVVGISIPETTVVKGSVLWLPIRADSSLTGRNVTSFEFHLTFYEHVIQPDSFTIAGSLLDGAGWSVAFSRPAPNVVRIAAAGSTALSGSGALVYVRVPLPASGWTFIGFSGPGTDMLNEGDPPIATDNGAIQINNPPSLDVYPDSEILAVGDQLQFSMWGGTLPVTWSTSDSGVAAIDTNGLLTALAPGIVRVTARDAEGIEGSSDASFVVRAIGVGTPNLTVPATRIVDVPVVVTPLTPWNVTAGSVRFTYNADALTPLEVVTIGTLLNARNPVVNLAKRGEIALSFATDQAIAGQGVLFAVRFQTSPTASWSNIEFVEAIFNEDLPARVDHGIVSIAQPTTISVDAGGGSLLVGDTLVLQAWGGDGAYVWTSSDTNVAMVDEWGRLTGRRSGTVRVTVGDTSDGFGQTQEIRVFDGAVQMPSVLAAAGGQVDIPVRLTRLAPGHVISSYQVRVVFNADILSFASVSTAGSATDGWATSHHADGNQVTIAAATSGGISAPGTLVTLRFSVDPSAQLRWEALVELSQAMMNEGAPSVDRWHGRVRIAEPPGAVSLGTPGNGWTEQPAEREFTWNSVEFAERYEIQVATDTAFTDLAFADTTLTATIRLVTGLATSTTYHWRVRAWNALGVGPWSDVWQFTTQLDPPPAPPLAAPADGSLGLSLTPLLAWHPAQLASSYTLQISQDSTFEVDVRTVGDIADTTHLAAALEPNLRYFWRVRGVNSAGGGAWSDPWWFRTSGPDGVTTSAGSIPDRFGLDPNFPNPFNPSTRLTFHLKESSPVTISIFTLTGIEVERLVESVLPAGSHETRWDASRMPSGVYLCRMTAGRFVGIQRLILLK